MKESYASPLATASVICLELVLDVVQVTVSKHQGISTTALLTKMDSPVGNTVGHALEVAEAVDCLHGNGPRPLVDLIATLG